MGCGCGKRKRSESSQHLPSIQQRAIRFVKAAYKHITTGSRVLTGEDYKNRIKICQSCENYNPQYRACAICGCYIKTKCRWADQECPLDPPKWKEA